MSEQKTTKTESSQQHLTSLFLRIGICTISYSFCIETSKIFINCWCFMNYIRCIHCSELYKTQLFLPNPFVLVCLSKIKKKCLFGCYWFYNEFSQNIFCSSSSYSVIFVVCWTFSCCVQHLPAVCRTNKENNNHEN